MLFTQEKIEAFLIKNGVHKLGISSDCIAGCVISTNNNRSSKKSRRLSKTIKVGWGQFLKYEWANGMNIRIKPINQ